MTTPTAPTDNRAADPIKQAVQDLLEETVAQRRDFHMHPEIAFEEVRTMGIIADKLDELGLEVRREVGKTGVVALLDSGRAGRTVLARADIDALPIQDEKEVPYRSQVPGAMHACGHDGHTAVLLSVAKLLKGLLENQENAFSGRVVFVFQPAEEIVGGAKAMLDDNALAGLTPDATIGLHLISDYPVGTVALRSGPAMAATASFRLLIKGFGGHAAKPHECVDPILISAQLITALQGLVARETDPQDSAVVSITSVQGGTAYNIIPEAALLKGTLRTFLPDTRKRLIGRIEALTRGLVTSLRGEVSLEWQTDSPAVINDTAMTERMRGVAERVVGEDKVLESAQTMGGDDMALWLQRAPGCYFFVGGRNEARGADKPHHHPQFDLDEASLGVALEVLAKGILDFLEEG